MAVRKIAVDPGFGNYKIAESNGTVQSHWFPAAVGLGRRADLAAVNVGVTGRSKRVEPWQVEFEDGNAYQVGHNLHYYTKPEPRTGYEALAEGGAIKALTYAALAQLGADYTADVVVAWPVGLLTNKELFGRLKASFRDWFRAEHRFLVDGHEHRVVIRQVRLRPQPFGTYSAFLLNEKGHIKNKADWAAPVGVIDLGHNTLDLFALQGGNLIERFTVGDERGVHIVADRLMQEAMRYRVSLTQHEASALIEQHVAGQEALLYHPAGTETMNPLIEAALNDLYAEVAEFIKIHFRGAGIRYLILTGGGAAALRSKFERSMPAAIQMSDPVAANAIGMAKYANGLD
jgi:hypothetical protein